MFKIRSVIWGLALWLVGCGGVGDFQTAPPSSLTLQPVATPIVQGQCAVRGDFEGWLQFSANQRDRALDVLRNADEKTREELFAETERLHDLLMRVSTTPALDCTEEAHQALFMLLTSAVEGYQAYCNGDRDDLNAINGEIARHVSAFNAAYTDLLFEFEARFGR